MSLENSRTDAEADRFIDLLTQHQGQIFGYIFAIARNLDDTRDIFQQTSLILWQKFDSFELGTNFPAWACRVARFEALQHVRLKRNDALPLSEALTDTLVNLVDDQAAADTDREAALQHCLEKLPASERDLLKRCYHGGVSVKTIAEKLGRSSQSICNSLRRIRLKLFECIDRTLAGEA